MTEDTSEHCISGVLMPNHHILTESTKVSEVSHVAITNGIIGEVIEGGIYPVSEILPHISSETGIDSSCAMYTAAIPADIAGSFPEGTVLQIVPNSTVLTVAAVKAIQGASRLNNGTIILSDPSLETQVTNSCNESNQNMSVSSVVVESTEQTSVSELVTCSEGNMSDIDLVNFLNEPEDSSNVSETQNLVNRTNSDIHQTLDEVLPEHMQSSPQSQNDNRKSNEMQSIEEQDKSSAIPPEEPDGTESNVVVIDVTKPIQLSQNSLIVVDGQKCVLQHDSETGQVIAYPVKEPEKPKRKRGRPRKMPTEEPTEIRESEVAASPSAAVDDETMSEEETIEKGLLEIMTDDGAVVRRSSRKRKKAQSLKDYETGNLKHELGSDADDNEEPDKEEELPQKKKAKGRGPGRPRKYPLPSAPTSTFGLQTSGKRGRGRPRRYGVNKDAMQAFLIQTADGQTLMMQVPVANIPSGMSLQDVAQGIANNLNMAVAQGASETLSNNTSIASSETTNAESSVCDEPGNASELMANSPSVLPLPIEIDPHHLTSDNVNSESKTISEEVPPAIQDHIIGSSTIPLAHAKQLEENRPESDDCHVDSTSEILPTTQHILEESSSLCNIVNLQAKQSVDTITTNGTVNNGDIPENHEASSQVLHIVNTEFISLNLDKNIATDEAEISTVNSANECAASDSNSIFSVIKEKDSCIRTENIVTNPTDIVTEQSSADSQTLACNILSPNNDENQNMDIIMKENYLPNEYVQNITISTSSECNMENSSAKNIEVLLETNDCAENVTVSTSTICMKDQSEKNTEESIPGGHMENLASSTSFESSESNSTQNTSNVAFTFDSTDIETPNSQSEGNVESHTTKIQELSNEIDRIVHNIDITMNNIESENNSNNISVVNITDISQNKMQENEVIKELSEGNVLLGSTQQNDANMVEPLPLHTAASTKLVVDMQPPLTVKRKRGRPRKHPLPEPLSVETTIKPVPKPDADVTSLQNVSTVLALPSGTLPVPTTQSPNSSGASATVIPLPEKVLPLLLPKPQNPGFAAYCNMLKTLQCPKCDFRAYFDKQYQEHLTVHSDETMHCKSCQFKCFTEEELIQHYKDNHPRCICSVCNHIAEHAYIIKRHMYRHIDNGCACTICGKTYKDHYILKMHIKMVHMPAEVLFECQLCSKKFNRKAHLKRHLRTHDPDKPFKCVHCDYRGCEKSDITKHMLIHEEPKHQCEICGKNFRHIKNKELHIKRHKGQRDYKCGVCDFFGYTFTDIRKHIERRHTDPRIIVCERCGQAFRSQELLKEHQNSNQCEAYLIEQALTESESSVLHVNNDVTQIEEEEEVECITTNIVPDSEQEVNTITTVTLEDGSIATLNALTSLQNGHIVVSGVDGVISTENGQIVVSGLDGTSLLSAESLAIVSADDGKDAQVALVAADTENMSLKIIDCPDTTQSIGKDDRTLSVISIPAECIDAQATNDSTTISSGEHLLLSTEMFDDSHHQNVPCSTTS